MVIAAIHNHCLPLCCSYRARNPFLATLSLSSSSPPPLNLLASKSLSFSSNLSFNFFTKGGLSISNIKRPIDDDRSSIVGMAARYGSNTRKRKIKSRRRGGDPEKKKKRKRKTGRKKKATFKIIKLASSAGTGCVYAKRKTSNGMKEKLELNKYDPNLKRHVLFKETK